MNPDQVERVASAVAQRINALGQSSEALKWLFLGNYVEQIIAWAWRGGALSNVALYLRECLHMKAKINVVEEVEGPPVLKMDPRF